MSGKITAITTDFLVDAIIIVMENYGKSPDEIRLFISSLIGFKHLHIYRLTLIDRIAATTHMKQFGLDFDDSTAYQTMKVMNIKNIISYDRHFDAISGIQRVLPKDVI
jgi:predicted nucleic acid-binding protein